LTTLTAGDLLPFLWVLAEAVLLRLFFLRLFFFALAPADRIKGSFSSMSRMAARF
jgi:hypothetical protein